MLREDLLFNHESIRSYTAYECVIDEETVEMEVSFHVELGPSTERRGDAFPVYKVPSDKMVWLSDWSFNCGGLVTNETTVGGSLGRITRDSNYVYVLNCSVHPGEMQIYSPARRIRYLPGEWIAVCFHEYGLQLDVLARATFRFTQDPASERMPETRFSNWGAAGPADRFGPDKTGKSNGY